MAATLYDELNLEKINKFTRPAEWIELLEADHASGVDTYVPEDAPPLSRSSASNVAEQLVVDAPPFSTRPSFAAHSPQYAQLAPLFDAERARLSFARPSGLVSSSAFLVQPPPPPAGLFASSPAPRYIPAHLADPAGLNHQFANVDWRDLVH